jgi:hypothetical protein
MSPRHCLGTVSWLVGTTALKECISIPSQLGCLSCCRNPSLGKSYQYKKQEKPTKKTMARRMQTESYMKQSNHISTQFEHPTHDRTNSRLREMSEDLRDAKDCNRATLAKPSVGSNPTSPLGQVERVWTRARNQESAGRNTSRSHNSAERDNAVQRWLAEPQREQAWNNVGEVSNNDGTFKDANKPKSRHDGNKWSSKSVAGSLQSPGSH